MHGGCRCMNPAKFVRYRKLLRAKRDGEDNLDVSKMFLDSLIVVLVNHIQVGEGATDFFDKPTRDFPQIKVVLDDDQKFHCRQIGVPISPPRARSYTKEIPDKDLCAPPCPW